MLDDDVLQHAMKLVGFVGLHACVLGFLTLNYFAHIMRVKNCAKKLNIGWNLIYLIAYTVFNSTRHLKQAVLVCTIYTVWMDVWSKKESMYRNLYF